MALASRSGSTSDAGGVSGPLYCGETAGSANGVAAARSWSVTMSYRARRAVLDVPSNCRALCLACHGDAARSLIARAAM